MATNRKKVVMTAAERERQEMALEKYNEADLEYNQNRMEDSIADAAVASWIAGVSLEEFLQKCKTYYGVSQ